MDEAGAVGPQRGREAGLDERAQDLGPAARLLGEPGVERAAADELNWR